MVTYEDKINRPLEQSTKRQKELLKLTESEIYKETLHSY